MITGKKAIIFDLDGTIADTLWAIRDAVNSTMRHFGFPEHDYEGVRSCINYGARRLCTLILPPEMRKDDATIDRVLDFYNAEYRKTYHNTDKPYDGIPEALSELRGRGYLLAMLSNKPDEFVRSLARSLLPEDTFTAAVGPLPGGATKPDPALTLSLIKKIPAVLTPDDCVMVGDSDIDLLTGRNVGMTVVAVSWGYRGRRYLEDAGAEIIIDHPSELTGLFA